VCICVLSYCYKKWEYNEEVHQHPIDCKKAYDSIRREFLYKILLEIGIPRKLVRIINPYPANVENMVSS